jgi:hypothetical protein
MLGRLCSSQRLFGSNFALFAGRENENSSSHSAQCDGHSASPVRATAPK